MSYAIEAKQLTKYYGDFLAVDQISFTVDRGEIFGLLGPNEAAIINAIKRKAFVDCLRLKTYSLSD